jgi:protein-disulfide isomerase
MRQIRQQYGNDVRLVWKDAPLPFHDRAMPAAVAGREVFAQGGNAKFWAYHDLMYQNQQNLDNATWSASRSRSAASTWSASAPPSRTTRTRPACSRTCSSRSA